MIEQSVVNKNFQDSVINENYQSDISRIEAKVKWYNPEKGYGFLVPEDELGDIFMHFSVLDAAGCRRVEEGDQIVCDVGSSPQGRQVLRVLEVKFSPREPRISPTFLRSRTSSLELEALEDFEGTVKWFNPLKGFGFIYPDDGERDIFFHASVLRAAGYESLEPGIRVKIKTAVSERGREARILTVVASQEF